MTEAVASRTAAPSVSGYAPPRWLRNAHLQSVLGTSGWRRRLGEQALAATGARTTAHIVDGGEGVRLQGLHSVVPGVPARGLVLLLHGWEGSSDSSYMTLGAARLLQRGFEVFRLNFRDHGDSHHLNPDLFHSNLIDEVVHAAVDVCRLFPARPLLAGGWSLGGNFALRLALRGHGGCTASLSPCADVFFHSHQGVFHEDDDETHRPRAGHVSGAGRRAGAGRRR